MYIQYLGSVFMVLQHTIIVQQYYSKKARYYLLPTHTHTSCCFQRVWLLGCFNERFSQKTLSYCVWFVFIESYLIHLGDVFCNSLFKKKKRFISFASEYTTMKWLVIYYTWLFCNFLKPCCIIFWFIPSVCSLQSWWRYDLQWKQTTTIFIHVLFSMSDQNKDQSSFCLFQISCSCLVYNPALASKQQ